MQPTIEDNILPDKYLEVLYPDQDEEDGETYVYPTSEFMKEGVLKHLASLMESPNVVVVCTNSSMTGRIRAFLNDPFAENLPVPSNFKFDGLNRMTFDFPEVYTAPDGRELPFFGLMLNALERAMLRDGGELPLRNLRCMQAHCLTGVQFGPRTVSMRFEKFDSREWFEFSILFAHEIDNQPNDDEAS